MQKNYKNKCVAVYYFALSVEAFKAVYTKMMYYGPKIYFSFSMNCFCLCETSVVSFVPNVQSYSTCSLVLLPLRLERKGLGTCLYMYLTHTASRNIVSCSDCSIHPLKIQHLILINSTCISIINEQALIF